MSLASADAEMTAADAAVGDEAPVEGAAVPNIKEPEEMTAEERSKHALKCKEIGNGGMKTGDWVYALFAYQEGIRYLEYAPGREGRIAPEFDHGGAEQLQRDQDLLVLLCINCAAALLKLGEESRAINYCMQALVFEPANIKAIFRAGQAHLALGNFSPAADAAKRVLELEPSNRDALQLQRTAEAKLKASEKQEKALFSKMLG
eukprot:TRINITY_DN126333_c0_g1_i1.p1 TRINITY_DN126333_c0_g1~~TRINITY_DN126333_c0_g1_i1.p1  ORF type:complete len:204 (-),score=53.27 TRINITY_DN126333_c0_g1_i1:93-704(-)